MTQISLVAAVDSNLGIGTNNDLLFKSKEDMEWFKQHTYGKPVIMGRTTYESIGSPLDRRLNIVLTRQEDYNPHRYVEVHNSIDSALHSCRKDREVMIIGGQEIYSQFIDYADKLYLTKVDHEYSNVDAYFPDFDESEWKRFYYKEGSESDSHPYSFNVYRRVNKA